MVDAGRISVISDSATPIDSIQPEQFHYPLKTDDTYPLFISPYNIVSQIPRSKTEPLPAFLQCGHHKKIGTFVELRLLDLSLNCTNICSLLTHYLDATMTYL